MTKRKDPKDYVKRGRPSTYNLQIAEEICEAIASSELGLCHLVDKNPHWPERQVIFVWRRRHPEFDDMYARAKEAQTEVCVEHMQEIMNEPHKYKDFETGQIKIDHSMLRMKMDAIKWQAAKLKPRKFGDVKQQENTTSEVDEDCKKRYRELDERNKKDY